MLQRAIERIENERHAADIGLLNETALRIDAKFRLYGVRRTAFQPLLERVASDGYNIASIHHNYVGGRVNHPVVGAARQVYPTNGRRCRVGPSVEPAGGPLPGD